MVGWSGLDLSGIGKDEILVNTVIHFGLLI